MIAHEPKDRQPGSPPLLPDVCVIALVPDRWPVAWQSRHHVLSRLAQYFHVIWCEPPKEWRDALGSKDNAATTNTEVANLPLFRPGLAESKFHRPAFVAQFTHKRRYRQALKMARRTGAKKIILYLWRPGFADALVHIDVDASVYHIDDEYSFSATDSGLDPVEKQLIADVDQVFIHSPGLMEKKGHINPNTARVPNGVDFAAFSALAEEPEDMSSIPRPRIGYVGYMKSQINFALLRDLARMRTDWSFVLIGPTGQLFEQQAPFDAMTRLPNVHYLGRKPKEALPGYVQHLDVCSMCYNVNDYTNYIYPLKVHEYFAAGKPVVATPIRSLQDFDDLIELADDANGWASAIERCLNEDSDSGRPAKRRQLAKKHDWNSIVGEIAGHFCRLLGVDYVERLNTAENRSKEQLNSSASSTGKKT